MVGKASDVIIFRPGNKQLKVAIGNEHRASDCHSRSLAFFCCYIRFPLVSHKSGLGLRSVNVSQMGVRLCYRSKQASLVFHFPFFFLGLSIDVCECPCCNDPALSKWTLKMEN